MLLVKLQYLYGCIYQALNFSKRVFYALLARLDPTQSRLKVSANLLFSSKMACFQCFFMKKKKFKSQDGRGRPQHTYVRHSKSTAFKTLKPFWPDSKDSEVFKMVFHALLARLAPVQNCLQVSKTLLFSLKMLEKRHFC